MNEGSWVSIAGIAALAFVIWMVVKAPKVEMPSAAHESHESADVVASSAPVRGGGENWRVVGWILSAVGTIGLVVGFSMKTSVETFAPSTAYSAGGSQDIINLGLLFNKGATMAVSLSAIGIGVFCIGVGAIIANIRRE